MTQDICNNTSQLALSELIGMQVRQLGPCRQQCNAGTMAWVGMRLKRPHPTPPPEAPAPHAACQCGCGTPQSVFLVGMGAAPNDALSALMRPFDSATHHMEFSTCSMPKFVVHTVGPNQVVFHACIVAWYRAYVTMMFPIIRVRVNVIQKKSPFTVRTRPQ